MAIPDYIDNQNQNLEDILKKIIIDEKEVNLDIATGFFRIEAWLRLEGVLNQLESLRILIGRDPTIRPAESDRINLEEFFKKSIQNQLETETYNQVYKNNIQRMIEYLQQQHIQVRLYGVNQENKQKNQFLHAKAYIFDNFSIVGSSNFTPAGLEGNTELNIVNKIKAVAYDLRYNWFNKFWEDQSVDTDYKSRLIETLNASKFGSKPYTPYQVFLKALYELFKEDTYVGESGETTLELANFQQEGWERAIKLIERHNGCIIADAVGLGKTYIGLRVLEYYLSKLRQPKYVPRALVVCPAQLRDLMWSKKLDEFGIKADIVSQEEISRDNFDISRYRNHDLVIVDESHSFRNSSTKRYNNLQKLLSGGNPKKRVLLLTATPINNSIYDLYHQISLITRSQDTYYQEYGIRNLNTYFKQLNQGSIEITELLMQTMVRRSRQDVIRRQKAGEEVRIAGKVIKFPQRQLEKFTYNFEASFQRLYAGIANQIDSLNLAPYNIKDFKIKKQSQDQTEIKRNQALVALQKALYLKRLESSIAAFEKSINNQLNFQEKFYQVFTQEHKLLDSKNFRKLILTYQSEEDDSQDITQVIDSLESIKIGEYEISPLQKHIEADIETLKQILDKLKTIKQSVADGRDYDRKLEAFKQLLLTLKGKKVIVFDYYKDTVKYVYQQLKKDFTWLENMGNPVIEMITGDTKNNQREEIVKRFAPKANCIDSTELEKYSNNPIDILICTDVLSEGQNLQDSGYLINLSLHWNPVRMIQRAGRIDRLGTDYENLYIYNCFPEEGLEELLQLVKRLQQRIAIIDREVGLDASVLGEAISERSLEELIKLKQADTPADKQAILEELTQVAELVSLDKMRLPLLEFIQNRTLTEIEEIPLGIHSTYSFSIPNYQFQEGGLFLAFKARDKHFWRVYPRRHGTIITDSQLVVTDKGRIFNWLKCSENDFPSPDELKPRPFDSSIFRVLDSVTRQLLEDFQKQKTAQQLKPKLSKTLNKIHHLLTDSSYIQSSDSNDNFIATIDRVSQVITNTNLKAHNKELKALWDSFTQHENFTQIVLELDEYFINNELYHEVENLLNRDPLEMIREAEIQLICYQWFVNG